jgi:small subunit ribosomal protein S17
MAEPKQRGKRKTLIGIVVRDKMDKTRRVDVERLVKHPRFGKYIRRRTKCYAHDEHNETRVGDLVEIMETRPLSRLKHWRIVRILRRTARPVEEPTELGTWSEGLAETKAPEAVPSPPSDS